MTGFIISFIWQKQRSFLQSLRAEVLPRSLCIRFAGAAEHGCDRWACWSSQDITHVFLGKCWGSSNNWHNSLLGNFCIWCRNQICTSADLAASSWSSQFPAEQCLWSTCVGIKQTLSKYLWVRFMQSEIKVWHGHLMRESSVWSMAFGNRDSAELCRPANSHSFGVTQSFFPVGCAQISS